MRSASVLSLRSKWCVVKGLSLNVDKTNVIKFNLNYFQDPFPVFYKHREINPLKMKCRLFYLKTQFILRSEHFSSRL